MAELSLTVLIDQMDGQLAGLEDFFANYKNRVEVAKLQAAEDLDANRAAYQRFQATAKQRRSMKCEYKERIAKITHELVVYLKEAASEEETVTTEELG